MICAVGKTPQLDAVHAEFRLKQNGIEIGEIADGRYVHAAQLLCRLGTDIQQIGHGQRPYLFPVVVLIDNGHCIGFLHVAAQLGIDLRKRTPMETVSPISSRTARRISSATSSPVSATPLQYGMEIQFSSIPKGSMVSE